MRESSTYQAILEEGVGKGLEKGILQGLERGRQEGVGVGRAEEGRRLALLLGEKLLGKPDSKTRGFLEAMDDPARIEELALRIPSASSWNEVLNPPSAVRPRRPRKR